MELKFGLGCSKCGLIHYLNIFYMLYNLLQWSLSYQRMPPTQSNLASNKKTLLNSLKNAVANAGGTSQNFGGGGCGGGGGGPPRKFIAFSKSLNTKLKSA